MVETPNLSINEQPVTGYSGTPLATKLGIKPGTEICLVAAPDGYLKLIEPLPEGTRVVSRLSSNTDIVHVFSSRKAELSKALRTCRPKLKPTGIVWVSWPKKSAKVPSDITEDTIRELALPLGFVDIKVCAVGRNMVRTQARHSKRASVNLEPTKIARAWAERWPVYFVSPGSQSEIAGI